MWVEGKVFVVFKGLGLNSGSAACMKKLRVSHMVRDLGQHINKMMLARLL